MNSAPLQERVSLSGKLLAGLSSHHDTILQTDADCLVLTPIHCKKKTEEAKQTYQFVCGVCVWRFMQNEGGKKRKSHLLTWFLGQKTSLQLCICQLSSWLHHCVVGNRLTACCRHVTAKKLYAEVTADSHGPARESSHNYGY